MESSSNLMQNCKVYKSYIPITFAFNPRAFHYLKSSPPAFHRLLPISRNLMPQMLLPRKALSTTTRTYGHCLILLDLKSPPRSQAGTASCSHPTLNPEQHISVKPARELLMLLLTKP